MLVVEPEAQLSKTAPRRFQHGRARYPHVVCNAHAGQNERARARVVCVGRLDQTVLRSANKRNAGEPTLPLRLPTGE